MLDTPEASSLVVAEANRFGDLIGERAFEKLTIFPLHGVTSDGRCTCGRPDCPPANAGKHPAIKWGSDDFPDGSKLWRRDDDVGVGLGLATGQRSGGIVILDVDTKGGGFETLERLEAEVGKLPDTLSVESPSGGMHLYFVHPGRFQSNAAKLGPGVDVRGEGGYVVLPGSPHRKGGHYKVAEAAPIAMLPGVWADRLPRAGAQRPPKAVPDQAVGVDPSTLRQRLQEAVKGRRGDGWETWRRIVKGERPFRQDGQACPDDQGAPLVHGVDEHMAKAVIWALANLDKWHEIPGQDIAQVAAASLSKLRDDVQELGRTSKWTPDHFAEKWDRAAEKAAGEIAHATARVQAMIEAATEGAEKRTTSLPLIVMLSGRSYMILDDRDPDHARHTYAGPVDGATLVPMCRQIWGTRRVLETDTKDGPKDMDPRDVVKAYGRPVERLAYDLTATQPRVDDLRLVLGPRRDRLPEPAHDQGVAAWLDLLGGSDPALLDWIAWACVEKMETTAPVLTLVGGAHVGKSLLAAGLARASGLAAVGPLSNALGRFRGIIAQAPILFSDEGLPRGPSGAPQTEEFRALVTAKDHLIEQKNVERLVEVHGNPRVILAANRIDRLFSNKGGHLSAEDVAAIVRRLLVVELFDEHRATLCKNAAQGLGPGGEGCPVRLARVAGHLRWIQTTRACALPGSRAGSVTSELRRGGDLSRQALERLEDAISGAAGWVAMDPARGLVWVQPKPWALGVGAEPGPLLRAVHPYVRKTSEKFRTHPVTGVTLDGRPRWCALDLAGLIADGVDFSP